MSKQLGEENKVHLSNLDEFLAASIVEGLYAPIRLAVRRNGEQGYVSAILLSTGENMEEGGIDFELSSCECGGLEALGIAYFLRKPVFTSSAYEFFDFICAFLDSFECVVGFTGNGWKIKVLNNENDMS
jgi:hypothetical protein